MAAKISYKIGGSYDSKGEKAAISGIKNITNAAKSFNLAVKGFVVAKVFEGINKVVSGSTEAFKAQNKALVNYQKAIANNSKISVTSAKQLDKTLNKLSRNNFFDGDTLNNAAALASNLGLDAEQIENVMSAATELTAAGIMPMDQAVKALSLSYSGNITQLKKYAPELANMTTQQLKNGEAVKAIAEVYHGYADTMANTFDGRDTQFKNSFSDLQAAVGSIGQSFKFLSEGKLMDPLNDVTDWLVTNRDNILKFVAYLPDTFKAAFDLIKNIIAKTFTFDTLKNLVSAFFKTLIDSIKNIGTYIYNVVVNIGAIIWNIMADFINDVKENLKNVFSNVGDSFKNVLSNVLKSFGDLWEKFINWITKPFDKKSKENKEAFNNSLTTTDTKDVKAEKKTREELNKIYLNDIGEASIDFAASFQKNFSALNKTIADTYGDDFDAFLEDLSNIMGKDLPEDLAKALRANYKTTSSTSSDSGDAAGNGNATSSASGFTGANQFVEFAQSFTSLEGVATQLATSFFSMLSSVDSVNKILNWTDTLLEGTFSVIEPFINSLLEPTVGFITEIGVLLGDLFVPILEALSPLMDMFNQLLAAVLNILNPIVTLIMAFQNTLRPLLLILEPFLAIITALAQAVAALLNLVIIPAAKVIATVVDFIYNAFVTVINGIISLLNMIPFVNIGYVARSNMAGEITTQANNLYTASSLASSGSASSSSASYSAARDIIVNVTYANSYVNGDARAIALSIYQEIKQAQALGY